MKRHRNTTAGVMLALALTVPVFAGEMHTDGAPASQPTATANGEIQTGTTQGEMQTGEAASTPEAADTVTAAALNLLQTVLTLL